MDLNEKLLSSFIAFEDKVNVNDEVHEIRTAALSDLNSKGFLPRNSRHGNTPRYSLYSKRILASFQDRNVH